MSGDTAQPQEPHTLRAAAKELGCSAMTLSRAAKSGRLRASLVFVNGAPKIKDIDLARQELQQNTDHTTSPQRSEDPDMLEASAREKFWKAELAELKFKRESGELVPAAEVGQRLTDVFMTCRTKLLGLPSRARQQLPHLMVADMAVIEALIRECLEELSE